MRHKDGHWIWILDRGKALERDENGRLIRAIGSLTDITKRKETEERLAVSVAMLADEKERLRVTLELDRRRRDLHRRRDPHHLHESGRREADRRSSARGDGASARRGLRAGRRGKRREDRQRLGALRAEAAGRAQQPRRPVAQGRLALQHPRGRLADPQREGRVQRLGHRVPGFHRRAHLAARAGACGGPRFADRPRQPRKPAQYDVGADRHGRPRRMSSTSSSTSTSTISRWSTTPAVTPPATCCSSASPRPSRRACARRFRGAARRRRVCRHPQELRAGDRRRSRRAPSSRPSASSASSMTASSTRSAPASA